MTTRRARLVLVLVVLAAVSVIGIGVLSDHPTLSWVTQKRVPYDSVVDGHETRGWEWKRRWGRGSPRAVTWFVETGFRAVDYETSPKSEITDWNVDGTVKRQHTSI